MTMRYGVRRLHTTMLSPGLHQGIMALIINQLPHQHMMCEQRTHVCKQTKGETTFITSDFAHKLHTHDIDLSYFEHFFLFMEFLNFLRVELPFEQW